MKSQEKMKRFPKNLLSTAIIMAMVGAPAIDAAIVTEAQTTTQALTGTDDLTVTDSGSISVIDTTTNTAVDISGSYSANLLNDGTIDVLISSDSSSQSAYGIFLDDSFTGNLINNGIINATATSDTSQQMYAYGISIDLGDISGGSLTNAGDITVNVQGGIQSYAYGIKAEDLSNATFTNSGTVNITGTGQSGDIFATALDFEDLDSDSNFYAGDITMDIDVTGNYTANAVGLDFDDLDGDLFINSNIDIDTTANNGRSAIELLYTEYITGTVTHSGASEANAYAQGNIYVTGFSVQSGIEDNGSIFNTGSLSLTAESTDELAQIEVFDIDSIYSVSSPLLSNSGNISVHATGDEAIAYGFSIHDDADNTQISNSGTLQLTASAEDDSAIAAFYNSNDELAGDLNNSGNVIVNATATNSYAATAYGVNIETLEGSITNSGNMSISAHSDEALVYSYGFLMGELNGTLTNSGEVSLSSQSTDGLAYTFGILGGDLSGSLTNNGNLTLTNASTNDSVYAYGIEMNAVYGELHNNGNISLQLSSTESSGNSYAVGLSILDELDGATVENNGAIDIQANATDGLYIDGSTIGDIYDSDFSSNGSINIMANAGELQANGISIGDVDASSSVSVGNINMTADATSAAITSGISLNALSGSLTLNGELTITNSSTDDDSSTYGVYIDNNADGNIVNNGNIDISANAGDSYALYLSNGTGSFTNTNEASINGGIYTGGSIAVINQGNINLTPNDHVFINGDFTHADSGVLQLGTDGTNMPQLTINGTATFAANSTLQITPSSYANINIGDSFSDVISAGTLNASNINVTDNSVLLDYAATVDGNSVDLDVTLGQSFADTAAEHNVEVANSVAAYWDTALTEGANNDAINDVLNNFKDFSNSSELATALLETTPLNAHALTDTTLRLGNTVSNLIDQRQQSQVDSGIATNDSLTLSRNIWIKPFANQATQDNTNSTKGYEADSYGIASGVDTILNNNSRLGAAFFYSQMDIDVNDINQRSEVESYQFVTYGSHRVLDDVTQFNWQAGIGYHQNNSTRSVSVMGATATADYNSWSAQLATSFTRDIFITPTTRLQPEIKALFMHYRSDDYTESGAGALNLNVEANKGEQIMVGLGMNVDHQFTDQWTLYLNTRANLNVLDNRDSITATYAGDSSSDFITEGLETENVSFSGGLGLTYQQNAMTSFEFIYHTNVGSDYDGQSISAKFMRLF